MIGASSTLVMGLFAPDAAGDDAAARQRWRRLVGTVLPDLAHHHPEWPVVRDHCFARIVLDAVHGRPWRDAIAAPAWRHMAPDVLVRAIALAEAIADGSADLDALNAASLAMRGKRPRGAAPRAGSGRR